MKCEVCSREYEESSPSWTFWYGFDDTTVLVVCPDCEVPYLGGGLYTGHEAADMRLH